MSEAMIPLPPVATIREQVRVALEEDIGSGDLTAALLDENETASAKIIAREAGVLCGIDWVYEVFRQVDPDVVVSWEADDGEMVEPDQLLCRLKGRARSLLSGERVALNFLQTLSGTATLTSAYVQAVAGTGARILDTRKTIPGLRLAQKYAVRCGGGDNHRIGLYDAILIKENHIATAGSITAVLKRARENYPDVETEIEVETLEQLREAIEAGAIRILLDNFSVDDLIAAVAINEGRARLEVSGNVTLETIRELAETGIDDISIGALTKHLEALDLSMLFAAD